jgi:hypothetical protein
VQVDPPPQISYYTPDEIVVLATDAGFSDVEHLTTAERANRYLTGRTDGLRAAPGESILLART